MLSGMGFGLKVELPSQSLTGVRSMSVSNAWQVFFRFFT